MKMQKLMMIFLVMEKRHGNEGICVLEKQQGNKMQFSQVGNIEKIKKSKQFSQDEATERTRKGRKDNKRQRGKDRSWMEE